MATLRRHLQRCNRSKHFVLTTLILLVSCSQTDNSKKQTNMAINFRASFCDPFKPDIIELGDIQKEKIIDKFEDTPWYDFLRKMTTTKQEEVFYSPSLEVENKDTKHGLTISAVGDPNKYEFYIFYKRPKKVK